MSKVRQDRLHHPQTEMDLVQKREKELRYIQEP